MQHGAFNDEHAIADVVRKFEGCEFRVEEFTHARHLTVAAWYVCHLSANEALLRMKTGLVRFIEHHGKQGYHETITRFWMEIVGRFLASLPPDTAITEKVNKVVERYDNKDVLFEYYSRERALSEDAKREWVEPDLKVIGSEEREPAVEHARSPSTGSGQALHSASPRSG